MPAYAQVSATGCKCCGSSSSVVVPNICTGQAVGAESISQFMSPGEFEANYTVSPTTCFGVGGPTGGGTIIVFYEHPSSIPPVANITSVVVDFQVYDPSGSTGVYVGLVNNMMSAVTGSYAGPFPTHVAPYAVGHVFGSGWYGVTHTLTPATPYSASQPLYVAFQIAPLMPPTFTLDWCNIRWNYEYPC